MTATRRRARRVEVDEAGEYAEVGEAASLHGWQGKRHKHYATEDIPLWRLGAKAAAWVRERVSTTIFPAMSAAFGMAPRSASALVGALQMCSGFKSVARSQLFVVATLIKAANMRRFIVSGLPDARAASSSPVVMV